MNEHKIEQLFDEIVNALWSIEEQLETIADSSQYISGECPLPSKLPPMPKLSPREERKLREYPYVWLDPPTQPK